MVENYYYHPSGLMMPVKKRPIAIDFFCGAGGFSLGVKQAGFDVVAASDWDVDAAMTYMVNLGSFPINIHFIEESDGARLEKAMQRYYKPDENGITHALTSGSGWIRHHPEILGTSHFWLGDVRKLSGKEILDTLGLLPGDVDLVFGGPPCQGFSMAGKREVMDPRNSLIFDFARLIIEIQPKTMCMENVPGILSMVTPEGIPVIDAFCKILEDGGFGGFDALKKTLLATSGAGAALKNSKTSKKETEPKQQVDEMQASLF